MTKPPGDDWLLTNLQDFLQERRGKHLKGGTCINHDTGKWHAVLNDSGLIVMSDDSFATKDQAREFLLKSLHELGAITGWLQ
jgi:hypothetical protein